MPCSAAFEKFIGRSDIELKTNSPQLPLKDRLQDVQSGAIHKSTP